MSKASDINVNWKQYGNYSGPVILGFEAIEKPGPDRIEFHVDRAFWLTTMVETGGKIGAIMAADGTGMTAGLDQHIAVFPQELAHEDYRAVNDQGTLWKLLRRLETVRSSQSYQQALANLWRKFSACGWYIAPDGTLRYLAGGEVDFSTGKKMTVRAGDLVFGAHIRNEFTPNDGKVPAPGNGKLWDKARDWALAFHALTAHVGGEVAQIEFGIEHLVKRTRRQIPSAGAAVESVGYGSHEITALKLGDDWPEEIDLAMCMYQAHSVNAPAIANQALSAAKKASGRDQARFARTLIELLGNSTYGRWDDDIEFGRYQRTRTAARASGLWSRGLFDGASAIMPKDLAG